MWDLAPRRFILFTPEFASDKPLAFQLANKTQQSQDRKGIMNWKLWFMNDRVKLICLEFWDDIFWKRISVLLLDQKNQNQGWGMVVKAQISILWEISLRGALFYSLLNSLILSVIFCEASDKPLAFQFANKTQQSQGRKGDYELGVRIYEWN